MEGRFKINSELGTGKQDVFDNLREHMSSLDNEESSLSLFRKDKQKQRDTRKSMFDDDVLKSYDMVQVDQNKSNDPNKKGDAKKSS